MRLLRIARRCPSTRSTVSSKAKRPTELERLVRVRDVFPIIEYVRALEARIAKLEARETMSDSRNDGSAPELVDVAACRQQVPPGTSLTEGHG